MALLSSLDLSLETVDEICRDLAICPKKPGRMSCTRCGLLVQQSCNSLRCGVCGPKIARTKARIAAWAMPERLVTLTRAPVAWGARRQKVRDLRRLLRRHGYEAWEQAWSTELTRNGVPHVHALQHGPYVPQALLQEVWGSIVDIRAIHEEVGAAGYITKEAVTVAGYVSKGARSLSRHLSLNGDRVLHFSEGFLRGRTQAQVKRLLTSTDHSHVWLAYAEAR